MLTAAAAACIRIRRAAALSAPRAIATTRRAISFLALLPFPPLTALRFAFAPFKPASPAADAGGAADAAGATYTDL